MSDNIINNHILSKSTFIRGTQCLKSLYLNKYHPELRDEIDPAREDIFRRGTDVGILARNLFPGGIDAGPEEPHDYAESVKLTRRLIDDEADVIYEAAFLHEGVLCLVDILVRGENSGWNAYEVKSSSKISDTYILDASLQYHVITGSGLKINNFYIVHINNSYVRRGSIDLNSLFTIKPVQRMVKKNQRDIRKNIEIMKQVLDSDVTPEVDIGEHCTRPYPCDFRGHCWKHIPENSVFNIIQIGYRAFSMYRKGIIKMEDIPDDYPLSQAQRLQVDSYKTGNTQIEKTLIKDFLSGISYPLFFMDFETFMPAVPLFDNVRPYQYIPFQYSLHYRESKNSELLHYEFLAETGIDPRKNFIERLLKDTENKGIILVYNRSFESARLKEIARDFPEYEKPVESLLSRIIDLMIPFQKKYYYTPEMKGRYSIKYVLPALDEEMSYSGLEISHGREAMNAFESLQFEQDPEKIASVRNALLEYCKLDTMALVKLLEKLQEAVA